MAGGVKQAVPLEVVEELPFVKQCRASYVSERRGAQRREVEGQSAETSVLQVLQGLDSWKSDLMNEVRQGFASVLRGIEDLKSSRPTTPSSRSFGSAARKAAFFFARRLVRAVLDTGANIEAR